MSDIVSTPQGIKELQAVRIITLPDAQKPEFALSSRVAELISALSVRMTVTTSTPELAIAFRVNTLLKPPAHAASTGMQSQGAPITEASRKIVQTSPQASPLPGEKPVPEEPRVSTAPQFVAQLRGRPISPVAPREVAPEAGLSDIKETGQMAALMGDQLVAVTAEAGSIEDPLSPAAHAASRVVDPLAPTVLAQKTLILNDIADVRWRGVLIKFFEAYFQGKKRMAPSELAAFFKDTPSVENRMFPALTQKTTGELVSWAHSLCDSMIRSIVSAGVLQDTGLRTCEVPFGKGLSVTFTLEVLAEIPLELGEKKTPACTLVIDFPSPLFTVQRDKRPVGFDRLRIENYIPPMDEDSHVTLDMPYEERVPGSKLVDAHTGEAIDGSKEVTRHPDLVMTYQSRGRVASGEETVEQKFSSFGAFNGNHTRNDAVTVWLISRWLAELLPRPA